MFVWLKPPDSTDKNSHFSWENTGLLWDFVFGKISIGGIFAFIIEVQRVDRKVGRE